MTAMCISEARHHQVWEVQQFTFSPFLLLPSLEVPTVSKTNLPRVEPHGRAARCLFLDAANFSFKTTPAITYKQPPPPPKYRSSQAN